MKKNTFDGIQKILHGVAKTPRVIAIVSTPAIKFLDKRSKLLLGEFLFINRLGGASILDLDEILQSSNSVANLQNMPP